MAFLLIALAATGCSEPVADGASRTVAPGETVRITTTTNIVTDLARQIGGDRVQVTGLMGPGVDPHLYKASAGDVRRLVDADLILYGGLELEGKMSDVFEDLSDQRPTLAVTRDIPRSQLLGEPQFRDRFDPHMWFDVTLWQRAARTVAGELTRLDPEDAATYDANLRTYLARLERLDAYAKRRLGEIPRASRVIVTSHDAFRYLGRRYDLDVVAIQGISTATEATTADVERVARLIARRGVKAVFVESSVPRQTIEAVLASARRQGQRSGIGRPLFSDAAGEDGTPQGTYEGMVRFNVDALADALR